jgi:CheY-like chemotaxis protein
MDQETVKRIFEPFFTTKGPGVGTGLGLSIVYGILKQHGGDIRCNSKLGSGTTFDIFLPAVDEEEKLPIKTSDTLPRGGSETIMIVDDDEAILSLLESVFSEMGYTVVAVSNGNEALSKYVKEGKDISLVILDLIMPEMDGLRCLDEILSFDPMANVMIASGYPEQDVRKKSVETKVRAWINKPYDVTQLLKTVRSVLDRT